MSVKEQIWRLIVNCGYKWRAMSARCRGESSGAV